MKEVCRNVHIGNEFHLVGVLNIVRLFVGLAVDVDNTVLDLQRLTGKADTSLDVVFTTVSRPCVYQSIGLWVGSNMLSAGLVNQVKILCQLLLAQRVWIRTLGPLLVAKLVAQPIEIHALVGLVAANGVACRIVENDDVVELYLA